MEIDREYYQKLTLAVYRVTEFFPEKEPLRFQIRELADKILANLVLANPHPENIANKGDLLKDIKALFSYFDLADLQNWVDPRNFSVLKREYGKIQKPLEEAAVLSEFSAPAASKSVLLNTGKSVENSFSGNSQNGNRQEKILEAINGNGMVKIGDLLRLFPGVNRRTVLREMDKICQTGAVVRNGHGRGAHYTKNGHANDINTTVSQ